MKLLYATEFRLRDMVTDNSISLKFSTLVSVHVCSTRGRVGQCTKYRTRTLLGCHRLRCSAARRRAQLRRA